MESAAGPEELALALEQIFRPVAPTVRAGPAHARDPGPGEPAGGAARGLLRDRLRGYSFSATYALLGHLTDRPLLLPPHQTSVVTRPDRQAWTFEKRQTTVEPASPRLHARLIFLADGRSVSAAETFLKTIEHHRLGEIVGSTTAGTTGNSAPFQVPGGYMVIWTQLKATDYDGSRFHGVGVRPTVPAARTLCGVVEGRDEVLEKALELAGQHP